MRFNLLTGCRHVHRIQTWRPALFALWVRGDPIPDGARDQELSILVVLPERPAQLTTARTSKRGSRQHRRRGLWYCV